MDHDCLKLPNGLRLIHVPMPGMHSVTVAVFVKLGSRYETTSEAGTSHLIEHMLFKGTERRPTAQAISETLDSVGGVLNASTDKELTVYWAKVAAEHLPLALDLLADMLRHSRLLPRDLVKEKRVVLEELSMLADDPQDWVHVLTDETLWLRQPLGVEVVGTRESIPGLRRSTLTRYLRQYYGPNNAVVAVAGGTGLDDITRLVETHFGDWPGVAPSPPAPARIPPEGPRLRVERRGIEQVNFCVAFPGIARTHPDRWALNLLSLVLGSGTSSRLFVGLRERLGIVYDIHAYTSHFHDTGSFVVYAATEAQKTDRALDGAFREIERLQRRRVRDSELRKAKQYFRGRLWLGLEDTQAVASWFGAQDVLEGELITPEEAATAVDAVSAGDLLQAARTYLQPVDARLVAVGPVSDLRAESRLAGA